jgi:hypothetical protein
MVLRTIRHQIGASVSGRPEEELLRKVGRLHVRVDAEVLVEQPRQLHSRSPIQYFWMDAMANT